MQIQKNRKGGKAMKQDFVKRFKKQKSVFLMLVAGLIWFLVFKYYPLWYIFTAFTNYGTVAHPEFVGLDNFRKLFTSPYFLRAFKNTMILSFMNLAFGFPIPIILALSLHELKNRFLKKSAQFIIYIPHFLSWVVVGGLFSLMLSPGSGIINEVLMNTGIVKEPIYFMASDEWFRKILVGTEIWKNAGYSAVVYIAAIAGVDQQLYEAARVDGAGRWKQMWHITLPGIRSTIATVLMLTVARILQIFEQILVMENNAVKEVSDVLKTYSYWEGINRGNIGYATAVGVFTSVVSLLLVVGCNQFSKKVLHESMI